MVVGLALVFAGSKFIPIVIGFLIGSGVFLACFVIGAIIIKGTGAAIGLSIVGLILGGVAGYYSHRFVEDYGVPLIAFVAAGVVVFILAASIPGIPPAGKIGVAIAAGILVTTFFLDKRQTPKAKKTVNTTGNSSGSMAIAADNPFKTDLKISPRV